MKLAYTIYLTIAIFVIPLVGTALYFVITGNSKDIDFAETEKLGNKFQRPLEDALAHLIQEQTIAQQFLTGEKGLQKELDDTKTLVQRDLDNAIEEERVDGERLKFTDVELKKRKRENFYPKTVKTKWDLLVKDLDHLSVKDSNDKHLELMNVVATIIVHSGDTSNLILDPELDTYYLVSVTLNDLPTEHVRFAAINTFVLDLLQRKTITIQDRKQLAVFAAFLTGTDRDNTVSHLETALDQHVWFYSGLQPSFAKNTKVNEEEFTASTTTFAELLDKLSESEKVDLSPKTYLAVARRAEDASFKLWHAAVKELDGLLDRRIEAHASARQYAFLITGVLLAAAFALSIVIIGTITRSIESVAGELRELALGEADLTRRISVRGSLELQTLAINFNKLMGKLLELTRQIQQSGTQVTSSSNEIAASTTQLEATLTEQAASTNEVVATSKEISATASTLANTMNEVGKVASDTAQLADSVQNGLDGMGGTMRQLADATGSISSKLSAISEKANNINKIVSTITKVADQTNLLSLNASIEAEKAGEHGQGFAVVAREIRRLADQTAVATLDIEKMVKEMHSAVSTGVMEMDKFTRDVARGADEVNEIGVQLAKIVERVQTLAPRFDMVSEGMQAQSQGAQQISTAMVQLSEAARQTMEALRQTNSAIQELNSAARGLHSEITRFKTTGAN